MRLPPVCCGWLFLPARPALSRSYPLLCPFLVRSFFGRRFFIPGVYLLPCAFLFCLPCILVHTCIPAPALYGGFFFLASFHLTAYSGSFSALHGPFSACTGIRMVGIATCPGSFFKSRPGHGRTVPASLFSLSGFVAWAWLVACATVIPHTVSRKGGLWGFYVSSPITPGFLRGLRPPSLFRRLSVWVAAGILRRRYALLFFPGELWRHGCHFRFRAFCLVRPARLNGCLMGSPVMPGILCFRCFCARWIFHLPLQLSAGTRQIRRILGIWCVLGTLAFSGFQTHVLCGPGAFYTGFWFWQRCGDLNV
jgi:hypothetical protein